MSRIGTLALALLIGGGCLYTEETWKDETSCEVYDCGGSDECTLDLVLSGSDLLACWGSMQNMPPAVVASCPVFVGGNCVMHFEDLSCDIFVSDPVNALTAEDAEAICLDVGHWEASYPGTTEWELDLLDEVSNQGTCHIEMLEISYSATEANEVVAVGLEGTGCQDAGRLSAPPGAEYEMEIDPLLSYVDVDLGTESVFTSLEGSAFGSTSPTEFLVAFAWAEDFEYDTDDFISNHVALSTPINVSYTTGTYTVPASQDFSLAFQGYRDSDEYSVDVAPTSSSGGDFDVPNEEWTYDHTQSGSGTSIEIHLEGRLRELDP